jgi:hypothetical protein
MIYSTNTINRVAKWKAGDCPDWQVEMLHWGKNAEDKVCIDTGPSYRDAYINLPQFAQCSLLIFSDCFLCGLCEDKSQLLKYSA